MQYCNTAIAPPAHDHFSARPARLRGVQHFWVRPCGIYLCGHFLDSTRGDARRHLQALGAGVVAATRATGDPAIAITTTSSAGNRTRVTPASLTTMERRGKTSKRSQRSPPPPLTIQRLKQYQRGAAGASAAAAPKQRAKKKKKKNNQQSKKDDKKEDSEAASSIDEARHLLSVKKHEPQEILLDAEFDDGELAWGWLTHARCSVVCGSLCVWSLPGLVSREDVGLCLNCASACVHARVLPVSRHYCVAARLSARRGIKLRDGAGRGGRDRRHGSRPIQRATRTFLLAATLW